VVLRGYFNKPGSGDFNIKSDIKKPDILPVTRSKQEARRFYNGISRYYSFLAGAYERKYAEITLAYLALAEGEIVLEIGFGTGHSLKQIAESVGPTGRVYGIDLSSNMTALARRRLEKAGLTRRAGLICGDGESLPFQDRIFDAVFMVFTLELFDTPEIPKVLEQIKRVLKPQGRLGIASMSRENSHSTLVNLYEWTHLKWPKYIDCRPIYLEQSLSREGFRIKSQKQVGLFLPVDIIIAIRPPS
jgi:ubiquinone/menaquinone biosynthesis C-methylase UbiE